MKKYFIIICFLFLITGFSLSNINRKIESSQSYSFAKKFNRHLNSVKYKNVSSDKVIYLSPVPGSVNNSVETNIIIGYKSSLSNDFINSFRLDVKGNESGFHKGKIIPVENNSKLLFKPDYPFSSGEKVTVRDPEGNISFSFSTSSFKISPQNYIENNFNGDFINGTDTVPQLTINQYGPTAPGSIFIVNFKNDIFFSSSLMILNNNGTPVFDRTVDRRGYDFDKQNNNLLTYYNELTRRFHGLNSSYVLVDSFWTKNGYTTDLHECRVMSDGSAWVMAYDVQVVNMSLIVPGGRTNANVTGLIIQHIDANKNVILQWRSWDHFLITDATHENLTAQNIDYVHGNSIEVDTDNNIIISSRHMDEVTKINSTTGASIWRLGGKNNQFTFINDTAKFSHQHDVRRISNGHITLFDNGNYHSPQVSRAKEYQIDELNKTITLVWQYAHSPVIFSSAMGNVQRLSNGNTLIGWGAATTTMTEISPQGSILYELSLPADQQSYRAFRYEWQSSTSISNTNNIPRDYKLFQNFPNPFNPATKINYNLPKDSKVTLVIYDILGRQINNLVNNEFQKAGAYSVTFNGQSLTSGVYFYKLIADKYVEVKKMVLIK